MNTIHRHFLTIAVGASIVALAVPEIFLWIKPFIPLLLGVIMFGMGTTIRFHDFRDVWEKRNVIFLAALIQYTVMPGLAVLISFVMSLPEEVMIGMVLVGSCPGGTASNVIVYLAKGNVALSVTMTMFSTLLAPLLTPGIIYLILSRSIEFSFGGLFLSVFQIVALPLFAGLLARRLFSSTVDRYSDNLPVISVVSISLIIACVMALNADSVLAFPVLTIAAVMLHNLSGLVSGYGVAKLFGSNRVDCRTIAIEIGMQNSGLGVALANQFFQPLSALPGAIFSLWHNLSGIVLARFWGGRE
ncbi:MAG: bile acid:sodium symporter family protein [Prosthecochloris sp.]|uniref:Bile acid:sodium symporter n=1 Tax=Chlorobium phaeobacteroides (strain BS1) TaxID=331678 RepID=B3EPB6_CHLPB|nr:bile acid:sodium symporter family protein [Prosthecochloris sp.]